MSSNSDTTAGLLSLPFELHERILRFVCEPRTSVLVDPAAAMLPDEDPNQLLHPCLLVCTLLHARTFGLMYRSVDVATSRRIRLLTRVVMRNPSLGKLVKRLRFTMVDLGDPDYNPFPLHSMTSLLNHLVNLTSLSTQGTDAMLLCLGTTIIKEAKCFGTQFSELSMKTHSQSLYPADRSIAIASHYFKHPIKHLSLDECHQVTLKLPSFQFSKSAPPFLESLILTRANVRVEGLKYMLKNSLVSLKTFVLDMYPNHSLLNHTAQTRPPLVAFIKTLPPALERLELYWNCGIDFPLLHIVSCFPNLRRLGWGGPLSGTLVLSDLPSKLEELVIERCLAVTSDHIVALLDGGTSNFYPHGVQKPYKLKEIEIGPGMGWTDAGWESVRAACKREGVLVGFARTHNGLKPHPKVKYHVPRPLLSF